VVKLGQRYGDGAEMAVIELVDFNTGKDQTPKRLKNLLAKQCKTKPARKRCGSGAAAAASEAPAEQNADHNDAVTDPSRMKIATAEFVLGLSTSGSSPRQVEGLPSHRSTWANLPSSASSATGRTLRHVPVPVGKTREMNYYLVNGQFYFVDLPGYGYARLPNRSGRLGN
jgi:hypothetical protein